MPRLTLVPGEPDPQRRAEARRQRRSERSLLIEFLAPRALGTVDDRQAQGARWLLERVRSASSQEAG